MQEDTRFTIAVFGESDTVTVDIQSSWSQHAVAFRGPCSISDYSQHEWGFSAAIIDARYEAEVMLPLMEELEARAIPFIFFIPSTVILATPSPYILSSREADIVAILSALEAQQPATRH